MSVNPVQCLFCGPAQNKIAPVYRCNYPNLCGMASGKISLLFKPVIVSYVIPPVAAIVPAVAKERLVARMYPVLPAVVSAIRGMHYGR